jgi:uncharacterized protein (DUF608 family)
MAGAVLQRREFLKTIGAGAGTVILAGLPVAIAGPFTRKDFEKLVPADKRLTGDWLRSLTARGERTVYRGEDLERIGMPIGGICAGQLYLGGDGKLWHWDIFNQRIGTGAEHYARPMKPVSAVQQGFAVRITSAGKTEMRPLERAHWGEVTFTGEYPIGYVSYRDKGCPISVGLEAFSPFIPLNVDDSSLPATILEFTISNGGPSEAEVELGGWLQNPVCLFSGKTREGQRRNRVVRTRDMLLVECSAEPAPDRPVSGRPDLSFCSFEQENYANWTATGTAFGEGPVETARLPAYQGDVAGQGSRVVNSHATAPGNSVEEKDSAKGRLTSPTFVIERDYISFLIGGGSHKGKTCMNLVVEGNVVLTATGQNNNRMAPLTWDVRRWSGKTAQLELVDDESGGWGNVGVDDIVFSDQPRVPLGPLAEEADFGTLCLALLQAGPVDFASTDVATGALPTSVFAGENQRALEPARKSFGDELTGGVVKKMKLAAGASASATFLLTWHMPNLRLNRLKGRYYATRFPSALAIAGQVAEQVERLRRETRLWHDTWYDSSLPYWFLDRTFLNTSILATSTCHRLADGRFYAWEGVGCCEGTCGHVWQYAHAMARLFPELERITREEVDFGLAQQPNGAIHFRGEFNNIPAIDAQAGTILRALREHQMTANDSFLKRNWPAIRKATEWLISKDADGDGLISSNQHNTLDTDWFGPVAWLSGLYLAALLAAERMARIVGDTRFAEKCCAVFEPGQKNIVSQLFDGEYFINKPDPQHLDAINSGTGCEIDQVLGQSWAFQVGLPRVLPETQTLSALESLWRYNFTPDVGPYREAYKAGRWYAMPGEAGLLMCTFPRSDWDYAQAKGKGPEWAAGYFNECMNGFEYQVAGHMLWEGMPGEGLAVTRAVHDRYHGSRRNPWNEIECGDHYARSMASYGVYLAACGFGYNGPQGHIEFAPRLGPEKFKCAFTCAEGWGTYEQYWAPRALSGSAALNLKWGRLTLRTLQFALPALIPAVSSGMKTTLAGQPVRVEVTVNERNCRIKFEPQVSLAPGQKLEIRW